VLHRNTGRDERLAISLKNARGTGPFKRLESRRRHLQTPRCQPSLENTPKCTCLSSHGSSRRFTRLVGFYTAIVSVLLTAQEAVAGIGVDVEWSSLLQEGGVGGAELHVTCWVTGKEFGGKKNHLIRKQ